LDPGKITALQGAIATKTAPEKILQELTVRLADFPRLREIGHGRYGRVYLARDPRNGKEVAVKLITRDFRDEKERTMFLREVEILASMDHETLLGFRGWVPLGQGEDPAILTEYMEGGSLGSMIDAEKEKRAPANWSKTQQFIALYGTAIGMMILHANRIIHRDLKADNVFLNSALEPKVGDFGLSKSVEMGATLNQSTHGGTPWYMAPEIHDGLDYAFPVDVYAFGMLVYVCITLLDPFPVIENQYKMVQRILTGERPKIPRGIAQNWNRLITDCWNEKPEKRPTFEEIVRRMGSADFLDASIDKNAVLAYQQRTLPLEYHLMKPMIAPPNTRRDLRNDGLLFNPHSVSMKEWSRAFSAVPLPYTYVAVPQADEPANRPSVPLRYYVNRIITNVTRSAFLHAGFLITKDERKWKASWGRQYDVDRYRNFQCWQKINHFAGAFLIGRKGELHDRMSELRDRTGDFASFYPEYYLVPRDFAALSANWNRHKTWIVKPVSSANGRGVHLQSSADSAPPDGLWVVQVYISRPFLITGRKFAVRLYAYISSVFPLRIYIHESGMVRFCTRE
jgi:serine/threonine protein kinase